MAGEPAIQKVLVALRAALTPAAVTVDIDRPDDDAYGQAELEAINLRHTGTRFESGTSAEYQSAQHHYASVDVGMIVGVEASASNAQRLREMEADVVALLWADRTLGGLVSNIEPTSSGGDDDVRSDEGERQLSLEIHFCTPVGDHRTVIGATGLIP
jgi:hypothetical protein